MIEAIKIAHIAFASAWFGHKLLIPRDVHDSIRDIAGAERFISRMSRARRLGIVTGFLTLGTGLWLLYEVFGFGDAPLRIWVALGVVVAMFLVGGLVAEPAWKRIRSGLEAKDAAAAAAGVVRFRRSLALENLLWILALTMMIID